ncbi:MAG: VacJ family lipoprotein [Desulfobacteraceae bacterium]|nr:VacJ family lipoprotein [Desulfobacteraceae bacterium]
MGNSGRVLFFLVCWLNMLTSFCFAEKPQTWSGHVEGETFLLATEVEGHELDRMVYAEVRRTEPSSAVHPSNLEICQVRNPQETSGASEPWEDEAEEIDSIPDPLEPMNRAFFQFNDKLYFWVLKPVATGYNTVVPQVARVCIRNFFSNLVMPIRAVSCLLQGKFEGLGIELVRFVVNTSAGFLGFQDVAKQALNFPVQDEDLGQVFAFYGIGPGFYLDLPFLGPYSLRNAVGWGGGLFINPLNYAVEFWPNVGVRGYDILNKTSLRIGDYEAMKEAALDPYVAMRDAYYQYRLNLIEK